MAGVKRFLSGKIFLASTILAVATPALAEINEPIEPSVGTKIQTQLQTKLQQKSLPSSSGNTAYGECFFVQGKSIGFVQKCKIVTTKDNNLTNRKIYTQNRIINIDSPSKDNAIPRYTMNALEAEQYYLNDKVAPKEAAPEKEATEEPNEDWTCFENIVMNVCYRL